MPGAYPSRAPGILMSIVIAGAALVAAALVAFTRDLSGWRIAGAVLVIGCLAVCVGSAVIGARSEREVKRAVQVRADARRAHARESESTG